MVARQAPLSVGFSRQEFWSGLPFPSPWIASTFWLFLGGVAVNIHVQVFCFFFSSNSCCQFFGVDTGNIIAGSLDNPRFDLVRNHQTSDV